MSWQAKISVAASSSTRSVTTRRIVGQLVMKLYSIAIYKRRAGSIAALATFPGFMPFLYQEVDDGERGQRIDPPRPQSELAARPRTTTNDSQPQVMLSIASARSARLPSCSATAGFRRERTYMTGMAATARMMPGVENSAP
jgi:hypothetical protein